MTREPRLEAGAGRDDSPALTLDAVAPAYRTKQEIVVDRLRDAILEERLAPGQWLRLRDLAELLGTSTMPIREALQLLASDGLVLLTPHRGAQVAPLSVEELEELYMARLGLEGLAARLAAAHLDASALGRMRALLQQMEAAIEAGQTERFLALDDEFHAIHRRGCGRPSLARRVERLVRLCHRYTRRARRLLADTAATREYHRALLAAFEARDGARAEQVVRRDLDFAAGTMRHYLSNEHLARSHDGTFPLHAGHVAES